jgi:hypothetical protein
LIGKGFSEVNFEAHSLCLYSLGGIYYHRWGDAPIHTLGVAMFVPLHQVHRFSDIGYSHWPFVQQATTRSGGDRWVDLHRRAIPSTRWWGAATAHPTASAGHAEKPSTSLQVPQYSVESAPAKEFQPLFGVRQIGWQGVGEIIFAIPARSIHHL